MKTASAVPTANEATAVRTSDPTRAGVPEASNQGSNGMNAPRAKVTKDDTAACTGLPSWLGSMPSSSRAWVSRAISGFRIILAASSSASCGSSPRSR